MIPLEIKKRVYTSVFLFLIISLMILSKTFLIFFLIIFGVMSIIEFLAIISKIFKKKLFIYIFNFLFIIYIFVFCILFYNFNSVIGLKIILFALLFGCIASDIGGFVFGKIFKGRKLTKISPNKTISGALGSIFFSSVVINFIFYYFLNLFGIKFLFLSIFTSITNQLGDLFFSYLKRKAKIKDTGYFLPGHGGFLDRLDGILIGLPLSIIFFIIIY